MEELNQFLAEWRNSESFVQACTSGSTGKPKHINLLKSDMIASARATNKFFGIKADSTIATPLSMQYIAGKMMAVRAEVAGCKMLHLPVSNNVLIDKPIDLLAVVPTQLDSLLKQPRATTLVRNILIGGAPLSADLSQRLVDAGFDAWLGYGMTETCSHVALRRVTDTIFRAMPEIHFSIDKRDCLVIESDRFSWKRLVTNDIVNLLSDEQFVWLGRYDNVINSGGIKIHPEIAEEQLRAVIPNLPPFYLVGQPDAVLGERLVMVAEKPCDDLLDKIKASFPDRKRTPKLIIAVDQLPTTPGGHKIARTIPD